MLCEFATSFPPQIAERLGRAVDLWRPFREETATELLMMGLVGLGGLGIDVDFSQDETADGADMEWNFVSPNDIGGGSYIRLLIQAKVAKEAKRKKPYWYYAHLDHKQGLQAQTLVSAAKAAPKATMPLYMFFHPQGALRPQTKNLPAVEGVNLVAAEKIARKVKGGCKSKDKKVDAWRPDFLPLSKILCWPMAAVPGAVRMDAARFALSMPLHFQPLPAWHPDFVASTLNASFGRMGDEAGQADAQPLEPQPLTDELRRAISGDETAEERRTRKTTRVIFNSSVTRTHPLYRFFAERQQRGDIPD